MTEEEHEAALWHPENIGGKKIYVPAMYMRIFTELSV